MKGRGTSHVVNCIAAIGALGGFSQAAHAQQQQQQQPSGISQATQIEEVTVTAERRSENEQSVPLAVSAFGAEQLKDSNVTSALDLQKLDTSTIVQTVDGNVLPFIRGVGTPLVTMGNESSIPVYVDGIYQTRINPAILLLNNVDQIEILKGPQGTLFGRNASGGLVNIITSDPVPGDPMQGRVTLGYGNYNTLFGSGYFADSLAPNVAFSLSGVYNNQEEGWGRDVTTGGDAWKGLEEAIRGKLVWNVDSNTTIKVTAEADRLHSDEGQQLQIQGQPQGYPTGSGLSGALPQLPFYDTRNDFSNMFVTTDEGGSITVEHDFAFAQLIETAAASFTNEDRPLDVDTTQLDAYNAIFKDNSNQFTNELRLVSNASSAFQWTAGLYYYQSNQSYDPIALFGYSLGLPAGAQVHIFSNLAVRSYAGYAQGTYQVLPRTDLTLGIRFTQDEDHGSGYEQLAPPGSGAITLAGTDMSGSKTFAKLTWRAALDYHFTDDTMGYVSASRGFKSGTFNLVPFGSDPVKPEVLTAYELGLKNELWDGHLKLNGEAFYYDYTDAQVNTVPAPGILDIQNAPGARVYGLDLDAEAIPMEGLTLKGAISLLHATYTNFPDAAFFTPGGPPNYGLAGPVSESANGNYLSRAPKVSYNVGARYTLPLSNGGGMSFVVNYAYNTGFYWDADNRVWQSAYGLLDAQVMYMFRDGKTDVRLWGSNLADAHYYENEFESGGPQGSVGSPAAPRTYGVMLDWAL